MHKPRPTKSSPSIRSVGGVPVRMSAIRLLWGTLVSNNLTWLEWTQTDRPRALKLSVSIESVK